MLQSSTWVEILEQIRQALNYTLITFHGTAISPIALLVFVLIMGITWWLSRFVPGLFRRRFSGRLDSTTTFTIQKFLHYTVLVIGFLIGLETLGVDLSSLAILAGFLGVGIGFGLQNITSNFISGLILLFERPIKLGDVVTVSDQFGSVEQIGMRATQVQTLDNIDIIIPNSRFIEEDVINWSHGEEMVRLRCPVGVAYGSDTEKVRQLLLEVARENEEVLSDPEPAVLFTEFGDSALNFELRVWIDEPDRKTPITSNINFEIDRVFRGNGVQIPFPQRDLHVRSSTVIPVQNQGDEPEENDAGAD